MNVKELNEKYQRLQNWESEYRKELISYINEAFTMHGNEFVLKPGGNYETWEEAVKSDDFCACEYLPTWLMIWDRHEFSHEIYPTRIYRVSDSGMTYIDGYDSTEGGFVEGWYANDDNDDLSSIADFINAVLEQEQEGDIRRCDHCGKPMKEGYYLGGEFACSDECCLALYNGDRKQMEEDLSHAEEDGGDCYWTEWESIYFDD